MRIISGNSCKIALIYLSPRFSSLKNPSLLWTTIARKDSLEDMKYWLLKKLRRQKQLCFIQLFKEKTNKDTQIFLRFFYISDIMVGWSIREIRHACVYAKLLQSCQLFVTPWTVSLQAPLSMGFSRQEYQSGFPRPPPGNLPDPGIKSMPLASPALAGGLFTTSTTWEALK